MKLARRDRVVLILLLTVVLFSLLVWGGVDRPPAPELGDYPGTEDVVQDPERYQGQHVSTGGEVVSTDPVVVRAEYDTERGVESIKLEVTDIETTVEPGDHLQVFGVFIGPRTVRATNVVVVPQTGRWYAWSISFVAGLWVLGRIISHWQIDPETGAFQPRGGTLRLFERGRGNE